MCKDKFNSGCCSLRGIVLPPIPQDGILHIANYSNCTNISLNHLYSSVERGIVLEFLTNNFIPVICVIEMTVTQGVICLLLRKITVITSAVDTRYSGKMWRILFSTVQATMQYLSHCVLPIKYNLWCHFFQNFLVSAVSLLP